MIVPLIHFTCVTQAVPFLYNLFHQLYHTVISGTCINYPFNPLTPKISLAILLSLPYSSCDVNFENLVFDQLIIHNLIYIFFILITCLPDIVLIFCKGKFCFGHSKELKG